MNFTFRLLRMLLAASVILPVPAAYAQEAPAPGSAVMPLAGAAGSMTLPQLEQAALQCNPTLAQAQAVIRAAEARRLQAGLLPNPVVGGQVNDFAFRALGHKPDYQGFVVQ